MNKPLSFVRARWWAHGSVRFGVLVLGLMTALALAAPWLGTLDPSAMDSNYINKPMGTHGPFALPDGQTLAHTFWLGSDSFGRDIYSRVIYGTRISLLVGAGTALLSLSLGGLLGMLAGYFRTLDTVLMRVMDGLMAIPSVLLAIALVAALGASVATVVVAIAASTITGGFHFSMKAVAPNFARMNPAAGLARMFGSHAIIELIKALAKFGVVGAATAWVLSDQIEVFNGIGAMALEPALAITGTLLVASDLRGANFRGATGAHADFRMARLGQFKAFSAVGRPAPRVAKRLKMSWRSFPVRPFASPIRRLPWRTSWITSAYARAVLVPTLLTVAIRSAMRMYVDLSFWNAFAGTPSSRRWLTMRRRSSTSGLSRR